MNNVALKTDTLKEALKSYGKNVVVSIDDKKKKTSIPLTPDNKDLLEFLNENIPLTAAQKARISGYLFADHTIGEALVDSVNSFYNKMSFLSTALEPFLEAKINDKWYPLVCSISKFRGFGGSWFLEMTPYAQIGGLQYSRRVLFGEWAFKDKADKKVKKTINEILKDYGLRVASKESIEHAQKMQDKLIKFVSLNGKTFNASGTGLRFHQYWGWSDMNIAWKDSPATVIVEGILENPYANREETSDGWRLPFVRVFSLTHKDYIFVDVEDMEEHVYHRDGRDKIVLPKTMLKAIDAIFNAEKDNIFGDLFHGRHGGIVVMANGPSGVGKTLTAEVFAAFQERPLYTMEMNEVGTSVKEVEANLQKIFNRAKKWNAVLLFDEADIFLSKRVSSDLERSAIVGIFLRLLDYYEGTFFLTTNRGHEIDDAFKGRVTLYLEYPELAVETKAVIWQSMLKASGLKVTEDLPWQDIAEAPLNGRQIRNQVRLLKLMYPTGHVTTSEIKESLIFAAT